jgi:glycosyltransferase involved in cell wall biosynthesis
MFLSQNMSEKIKIIFISHNFHFLSNIINNLNKEKYEITTHETKISTNELSKSNLRNKHTSELLEIIGDNQIVWVEWLLTPACLLSHVPDKKFKLICRLHSYEYFYKNNIYINSTNFLNINKLIVVNNWFKDKLIQKFNVPASKITVFPILFTKYSNKNIENRQKNLGIVGINSLTNKGFDKILDIYDKIYKIDPSYKLHIKGGEIKKYTKNPFLSEAESLNLYKSTIQKINTFKNKYPEHIIFHPHSNNGGEDMETFYNQIGFLLCASIYESFHCSIMEAGSSGCFPVIYEYFNKDVPKTPDEYYLFKFTNENDIIDFIIKIKNFEKNSIKIQNYFKLLNKNYMKKFDKIIQELNF